MAQCTEIAVVIRIFFLLLFLFLKYSGFGTLCTLLVSDRYLLISVFYIDLVLRSEELYTDVKCYFYLWRHKKKQTSEFSS